MPTTKGGSRDARSLERPISRSCSFRFASFWLTLFFAPVPDLVLVLREPLFPDPLLRLPDCLSYLSNRMVHLNGLIILKTFDRIQRALSIARHVQDTIRCQ
jgi:hypothetical protein